MASLVLDSRHMGFSSCSVASVVLAQGLISCGSQALEHADFSDCSMQAQQLQLESFRAQAQ